MTLKKYKIIVISAFIILTPLMGWAAASGNVWLIALVFSVGAIIIAIFRTRVKERTFDERENTITEKSTAIAWLIFFFLALASGTTLTVLGRDTLVLLAIGLTLIGSAFAISVFMLIARLYISRKLGGKA